jgi:tRNA threonylcarbamoyladenosine biosynthesis protein TsaB
MELGLLRGFLYRPAALYYNRPMLILAIDTSTRSGGLAALKDREMLWHTFTHSPDDFSTRLFRELDQVLCSTRLKLEDFDTFGVVAGPGSFTGLRIGMTAVKGWSEVFGKPVAAVSGMEALAAQASEASEIIVPVMDARRGQVFGAVFRRNGKQLKRIGDELLLRPEELLNEIGDRISGKQVRLVSPTPELYEEAVGRSEVFAGGIEKVSDDISPWVGQLAFDRAQRGELVDALTLDANYIRRCDAEAYWQDV